MLKSYLLLLVVLLAGRLNAQEVLTFNKKFVESEDKWGAFKADKDGVYPFGFIYIDERAGLTLNYEGTFKIAASGKFVPTRNKDTANMKIRLEPNEVLVAFIPEEKFKELGVQAVPQWLKAYKTDTNSLRHLYHWGFLYNDWGNCGRALPYLQRAQKMDPDDGDLATELAFSYNFLGQYDSAVSVLQRAIQRNSGDAYTHKELIYAEVQSGQLEKAAQSLKQALEVCSDTSFNGENCYNLLAAYYRMRDKKNFDSWVGLTKRWNSGKEEILGYIRVMEEELGQ